MKSGPLQGDREDLESRGQVVRHASQGGHRRHCPEGSIWLYGLYFNSVTLGSLLILGTARGEEDVWAGSSSTDLTLVGPLAEQASQAYDFHLSVTIHRG